MGNLTKDIQLFLEEAGFYRQFPQWNRAAVEKLLTSLPVGKKESAAPPTPQPPAAADSASHDQLVLFTDGAARGNPGPAGIGIVIQTPDGKTLKTDSQFLGDATNNIAEYRGLIAGLALAEEFQPEALTIRMDSELVVKQISGQYKVKNEALRKLHRQAQAKLKQFDHWSIQHVRRERNREADRLANLAIDNHGKRSSF